MQTSVQATAKNKESSVAKEENENGCMVKLLLIAATATNLET